jgi:hypothetical protein
VLVHIGPYKTGSTAIQHSLTARRSELEEHGVWYPGPRYRHMRQSWAVLERSMRGVDQVPMSEWGDLAEGVRARPADRVCLSSEDFVLASTTQVERIVHDLGADRVHVLLVARRLDRILPSGWQERVKSSNETLTYDDFLAATLAADRSHRSSRNFWFNHELAAILARWSSAVPAERLHVLVADEERHERTARVFEQLLGLPDGLLVPAGRANASLSYERVSLVRRLNEIFDEHGWSDRDRLKLIHWGMLRGLETVPFGEHETSIPPVPVWAHARLAELDQERIDSLQLPGLDVIGDPELLRSRPGREVPSSSETLGVEAVARAVEGVVAARLQRAQRRPAPRPAPAPPAPTDPGAIPGRALVGELGRRLRRRLTPRR